MLSARTLTFRGLLLNKTAKNRALHHDLYPFLCAFAWRSATLNLSARYYDAVCLLQNKYKKQ